LPRATLNTSAGSWGCGEEGLALTRWPLCAGVRNWCGDFAQLPAYMGPVDVIVFTDEPFGTDGSPRCELPRCARWGLFCRARHASMHSTLPSRAPACCTGARLPQGRAGEGVPHGQAGRVRGHQLRGGEPPLAGAGQAAARSRRSKWRRGLSRSEPPCAALARVAWSLPVCLLEPCVPSRWSGWSPAAARADVRTGPAHRHARPPALLTHRSPSTLPPGRTWLASWPGCRCRSIASRCDLRPGVGGRGRLPLCRMPAKQAGRGGRKGARVAAVPLLQALGRGGARRDAGGRVVAAAACARRRRPTATAACCRSASCGGVAS
jgi:hypothetical protein